ncbi:MAG: histidinol-phosphate transaminase, partial [Pseudomonadales bacterium]|nr:histidinol-phosphate transaminase [Pseudomonadales bacterium]
MTKYWSKTVTRLNPYTPGEQPQDKPYTKLNTNENPYPPSPSVISRLKDTAGEKLRLYPDPECSELKEAIAKYYKVSRKSVFVGNGSDEVLAFSFSAFFDTDKKLHFPDITYSFYPVYCSLYDINFTKVPLNSQLEINTADYEQANGPIILPNPNAPTGIPLNLEQIEHLLLMNKEDVVIIDEAYVDFGAESAIPLIEKYPNLLVIQTFSKSRSLAGLRCGFAIGNENLIEALERVKNSFNSYPLDQFAIKGAVAALEDEDYFQDMRQRVITTRNRVRALLNDIGFNTLNSAANFLFITHPKFPAKNIYQDLKTQGILVRYFDKPRIDNYLRVSVGTDEEMDQFISEIYRLIKA